MGRTKISVRKHNFSLQPCWHTTLTKPHTGVLRRTRGHPAVLVIQTEGLVVDIPTSRGNALEVKAMQHLTNPSLRRGWARQVSAKPCHARAMLTGTTTKAGKAATQTSVQQHSP